LDKLDLFMGGCGLAETLVLAFMIGGPIYLGFVSVGCTENERAKNFGGTMTVALDCGQMLYDVSLDGYAFWYATRPFPEGYEPTTYTFKEESSFDLMQGKVIIREKACR